MHVMSTQIMHTNDVLLMRNDVQLCLVANNIPLMRRRNHAFLLLACSCMKNGRLLRFPNIFIKKKNKQTWSAVGDRMIKKKK